eukprot:9202794-Heterocapsa_arctica.AAC.1
MLESLPLALRAPSDEEQGPVRPSSPARPAGGAGKPDAGHAAASLEGAGAGPATLSSEGSAEGEVAPPAQKGEAP